MKVTKVNGLTHKKFEEMGKIVSFESKNKNENLTDQRLEELKELRLDGYLNKVDDKEDVVLKNLKRFFSEIRLREKDGMYILVKTKKFNNEGLDLSAEKLKKYVKPVKKYLVLNEILKLNIKNNDKEENIEYDSKKLEEVFESDFKKKKDKIKAIKRSLETDKAIFTKIDEKDCVNGNVKGESKRSKFYEYYRDVKKLEEYRSNIRKAFELLYKKEKIAELCETLKGNVKFDVRTTYKNIINEEVGKCNEITSIYPQILKCLNQDNTFLEFLSEVKNFELRALTKSQIFYKYFLSKSILSEKNIEYAFPYFVEVEVNTFLKENVYRIDKKHQKSSEEVKENIKSRIIEIFSDYKKLESLVVNKLENKLNNYIRNCGKNIINLKSGESAISDINIITRENEAFLRNIIGMVSFVNFSLRNILGANLEETKLEHDITLSKNFKNQWDKIISEGNIDKVKKHLKLFYNYDFENVKNEDLKEMFENIIKGYNIRHKIVHYNNEIVFDDIFNFLNEEEKVSELLKELFEKEIDDKELKLKVFRQLNSAGVFDYWDDNVLREYLKNTKIRFTNKNIPFVPSFTKLYNRIDNLKGDNALKLGSKICLPKRKEIRDSQIYLLNNIYYGEFIEEFVKDKTSFDRIVKEIIDINKNSGENLNNKSYKLERFENLEADTTIEYLSKLQSLHKINYDKVKVENTKDVYVDFVQKIFLKGFVEYLQKSKKYSKLGLLNLNIEEIKNDKKSKYQEELNKLENNPNYKSKTLSEINEFINIINVEEIRKSDNLCIFYAIIKLLDHKELTNLRGNLEKYRSKKKSDIYEEELKLLNYISLDNNKVRSYFELSLEEVSRFLKSKFKITTIKELQSFSGKYSDGVNIIKYRSFYNIKKYGVLDLMGKIIDKANYKVTWEEIDKLKSLEKKLEKKDFYKIQERIHKQYNGNDIKKDKCDFNEYKKAINYIQNYTQLKSMVEFNDLNLLQSIMFRILHRLVGYTSIWERNLEFELKGKYPNNKYIDEIFKSDHIKNEKYNSGGIVEKYCYFLVDQKSVDYSENQRKKAMQKEKLRFDIRNYISHYNYLPNPKKSILEILDETRELLSHDRKLKNSLMKSIKDIFNEYGFKVEFKIINTSEKIETTITSVESNRIKHLNNSDLITEKHSKKLCDLVKEMLEYKEE